MYDFCFVCTVFNREKDIIKYVLSMLEQDYSSDKFIVAVIDNGSSDDTLKELKKLKHHKSLKIFDGSHVKGSPYSARNIILKNIDAENYCFMDGYPEKEYLLNAKSLELKDTLYAGNIQIEVDQESSIYEIYDSIFNLDVEKNIKKFNRAPTGNIIINKGVIRKNGFFDEKIRSGGDMIYTSQAVKNGMLLKFSELLRSKYMARDKIALYKKKKKKNKRVAIGQVGIWKSEKKELSYFSKAIIKLILPSEPYAIINYIDNRSIMRLSKKDKFSLYLLHEKFRVMMAFYNIKTQLSSLMK